MGAGYLHARDQGDLEDMLDSGRALPLGYLQGSVQTAGHLMEVAVSRLGAIVGDVDVGEDSMDMQTGLLACRKKFGSYSVNMTSLFKYKGLKNMYRLSQLQYSILIFFLGLNRKCNNYLHYFWTTCILYQMK